MSTDMLIGLSDRSNSSVEVSSSLMTLIYLQLTKTNENSKCFHSCILSLSCYNKLPDSEQFIVNRKVIAFWKTLQVHDQGTGRFSRLCSLIARCSPTPVAASSEERHAVSSRGEAIEDQVSKTWREASVGSIIPPHER